MQHNVFTRLSAAFVVALLTLTSIPLLGQDPLCSNCSSMPPCSYLARTIYFCVSGCTA
jgi:hypothetical protein